MNKNSKSSNGNNSEAYQKHLRKLVESVGRNESIILNDEQIKNVAELRVRGKYPADNIVENTSHIVVYSLPIQLILDDFKDLETFWNHVLSEFYTPLYYKIAMVIHFDVKCPHIHLIIKTDEYLDREQIAIRLSGLVICKDGRRTIYEDAVAYYFGSLEEVFDMFLEDFIECVHVTVLMTPNFIEYIENVEECKKNS